MVLQACPDIVDYAKGGISHWRDFLAPSASCGAMLGISPSAWEAAQAAMGEIPAAIVIAAILQRGAITQRRRVSPRPDAKSRGGRILARPHADGADFEPETGKEARLRDGGFRGSFARATDGCRCREASGKEIRNAPEEPLRRAPVVENFLVVQVAHAGDERGVLMSQHPLDGFMLRLEGRQDAVSMILDDVIVDAGSLGSAP